MVDNYNECEYNMLTNRSDGSRYTYRDHTEINVPAGVYDTILHKVRDLK